MTQTERRGGRPRVSSRDTIADAACELFLEQGYAQTSVADIATRAGVSRATFFNYFETKADVIWSGIDDQIIAVLKTLSEDARHQPLQHQPPQHQPAQADAVDWGVPGTVIANRFTNWVPDSLALVWANAEPMGIEHELWQASVRRQAQIAQAVSKWARFAGMEQLRADIFGAAHGAAVMSSLKTWALAGAGQVELSPILLRGLTIARALALAADDDSGLGQGSPAVTNVLANSD